MDDNSSIQLFFLFLFGHTDLYSEIEFEKLLTPGVHLGTED